MQSEGFKAWSGLWEQKETNPFIKIGPQTFLASTNLFFQNQCICNQISSFFSLILDMYSRKKAK